jgi:hypothetical protein
MQLARGNRIGFDGVPFRGEGVHVFHKAARDGEPQFDRLAGGKVVSPDEIGATRGEESANAGSPERFFELRLAPSMRFPARWGALLGWRVDQSS